MYVYKITNKINNKVYVGITKDYKARWRQHVNTSNNKNHAEYEKVLYKAFRKYGIENFEFEVTHQNLSIPDAKAVEISAIEDLNSLAGNEGYNVTPGGDLVEESRALKGEDSPRAKLTEAQAKDIIHRRDSGELQQSVFADYSDVVLFNGGFQSIWSGNSWKHLQPKVIPKRHGRRHLTDDQVRTIRNSTESGKALAYKFGVPTSTISNIINYKTYKNVT